MSDRLPVNQSIARWVDEIVSGAVGLPFRVPLLRRLLVRGLPTARRTALARYALQQLGFECAVNESLEEMIKRSRAPGLEDFFRAFCESRERLEGDQHSVLYALQVYALMCDWISRWASGVSRKRILEFGPGWSLGTGALLVAAGAQRYVGADLFPLAALAAEPYRHLRDEIARDHDVVRSPEHASRRAEMLRRFDEVVRLDGSPDAGFDESRLAWRCPVDAAATPFGDGEFDVVLSNATLEHVRDPPAVVRESLRVVAPGGVGFHQIDFRDHRDFARPLEFLKVGPSQWEAVFAAPGQELPPDLPPGRIRAAFEYTNRWRVSDFVRAFESAGAEILAVERNLTRPLDSEEHAQLAPEFGGYAREDLETLGALLVVRRR
jgi:SAM-dependent methyltransferase